MFESHATMSDGQQSFKPNSYQNYVQKIVIKAIKDKKRIKEEKFIETLNKKYLGVQTKPDMW